jgi:hypothetical protein
MLAFILLLSRLSNDLGLEGACPGPLLWTEAPDNDRDIESPGQMRDRQEQQMKEMKEVEHISTT